MDSFKATPQDIYEVLEQQKKLQEMRLRIAGVLEKVNQTINSITVENLEITSSQIETLSDEHRQELNEDQKPVIELYDSAKQEMRAEEINNQLLDLELSLAQSHQEAESDEDELELCE